MSVLRPLGLSSPCALCTSHLFAAPCMLELNLLALLALMTTSRHASRCRRKSPLSGAFANATGAAYEPFLQPTLEALSALLSHSHRLVREHVCRALPLVLCALRAQVEARGADAAAAGAAAGEEARLAGTAGGVMARLAVLVMEDTDVSTVRTADIRPSPSLDSQTPRFAP